MSAVKLGIKHNTDKSLKKDKTYFERGFEALMILMLDRAIAKRWD